MDMLNFTSIQAANADPVCAAIADYVGKQVGLKSDFFAPEIWQQRERAFDADEAQVCWMCGAVYVRKLRRAEADVELLAAPVMAAPRYEKRPVYFSDVIVRTDSGFQSFSDLRGARWAYNEPHSHSGYTVTRWYLAGHGYGNGFFGLALGSGAHQRSLQLVLAGEVEATAIDSTVLETELARNPQLASQIRVIETFGPSPIPPWVMHAHLPAELKAALRQAFSEMDHNEAGRSILAMGQIDHFAPVNDSDYDPIRTMTDLAQTVTL